MYGPHKTTILLSLVTAVSMATFFLYYLAPIARQIGLVDNPSDRKRHKDPVPLVGGISIAISLFLALPLMPFGLGTYRYLFMGLGILVIVGILDDHRDIPPPAKIIVQFLVSAIIVGFSGVMVDTIGDIFGWNDGNSQGLGILAAPLTVIAAVGVINAMNMVDGHDGLAGSLFLLAIVPLVLLCGIAGLWKEQYFLTLNAAVVATFLIFNLCIGLPKERKVFLGDAGSMFLGLVLVFSLVSLSEHELVVIKTAAAPWLIGLPLLDLLSVILLRIRGRVSPLRADRRHIHHLLLDAGIGKYRVLMILVLVQALFSTYGFFGSVRNIPDWLLFWPMFLIIILYLILYRFLAKRNRRKKKVINV